MQDPEIFLQQEAITLLDPVDPARPAVIYSAHCTLVNYEVFFFAGTDTQTRFQSDPLRYCGLLTDPVTQVRFRPSAASPSRQPGPGCTAAGGPRWRMGKQPEDRSRPGR